MKVIEIEQGSEEWLEFRKGKSGGSEFKNLWISKMPTKSSIIEYLEKDGQLLPPADKALKVNELVDLLEDEELVKLKLDFEPKQRYYQLIAERVARPITPNDYVDRLNGQPFSMLLRGHILEKDALKLFEKKMKKKLDKKSVVWVSDDRDDIYISPDGCISKNGKCEEAVEVKCLGSDEIVKAYLLNKPPKEYEVQYLKYFMVNDDLKKLYVVLYTDVIPGLELQVFVIKRKDVEGKLNEMKLFEKVVMDMVEKDSLKIEKLSF